MTSLGIDVETTKIPTFHPWQPGAYLVAVGICDESSRTKTWVFNHDEAAGTTNQRQMIEEIQQEINKVDQLVGHNLKFDLNWLRSIGLDYSRKKLYCTKLVEYLISGQDSNLSYSLAAVSKRYGIPDKIDKVKTYWEAGYETAEVPLSVLLPYLERDCINTLLISQKQVPQVIELDMVNLVALHNEVQRSLAEIEYNGMLVDKVAAEKYHKDLHEALGVMDIRLAELFEFDIKLNSGDELSAALFGGILKRDGTEEVQRTLKSGVVKTHTRRAVIETEIKGAKFKPQKSWELKKGGYFSTDKGTIKQLVCKTKEQKEIKELLLERSAISKACETFKGKDDTKGLISKIHPVTGLVHPQYNQTVTKTGRLSSQDPESHWGL